jgi:hypothetical protein
MEINVQWGGGDLCSVKVQALYPWHRTVQTASGAHTLSYPVGTRGSFLGGKAAGA